MKDTKKKINIGEFFGKLIYSAVLCFALITTALSVIGVIGGSEIMAALPCSMLLWTLLFSLLTALAFAVSSFLKSKKVNAVVNCAVHFVLTYIAFILVYVVGGGASGYLGKVTASNNKFFSIIMMTFCFIGIYAVVGLIRMGAATLRHKLTNRNKEYDNVYSEIEKTNTENN